MGGTSRKEIDAYFRRDAHDSSDRSQRANGRSIKSSRRARSYQETVGARDRLYVPIHRYACGEYFFAFLGLEIELN